MSDTPSHSWLFYIDDMIQFANKVITWSIVTSDIPALLTQLHAIRNSSN
jgi:uncharacterized protein with HEPN domain